MIVRDDGAGFDAAAWYRKAVHGRRTGLAGIRERVALLGGTFAVDSAPGGGTRVAVSLPLPRA